MDGSRSTGTGFFFKFREQTNGAFVPAIITNKHVVKDAVEGIFYLTPMDEDGNPIDNNPKSITFIDQFDSFENRWHLHPDPNVDLCAMGITDVSYLFRQKFHSDFFAAYLDKSHLPQISDIENMSAIEDVYMIGYPNGIWDHINNKPIIRKGITATNIKFDYQGDKEFLIDMACFPGSSGSPIVLVNVGMATSKLGAVSFGENRLLLLGILYAGPQHQIEGALEISQTQKLKTTSHIPNNLGYVIKSERIIELEQLFS
jgi:hypothetical protein